MNVRLAYIVTLLMLIGLSRVAGAQCGPAWVPGNALGFSDEVLATAIWDPDGAGPKPELLIVGGRFTDVTGIPVSRIASYDGAVWKPLGEGVDGAVRALTVFNGELVAAGEFLNAGGTPANRIARWDGTMWRPLGSGINGPVNALTTYSGLLVAGGEFTNAGGSTVSNLALWTGAIWAGLGGANSRVNALTTYNGDLIAAGWFTSIGGVSASCIARYNGFDWLGLSSGLNGQAFAVRSWEGDLYVGGTFLSAGGVSAPRIAKWNGHSWSSVGGSIPGPGTQRVSAFGEYAGSLVVAGEFSGGATGSGNIRAWTGSSWNALPSASLAISCVASYRNTLHAGGKQYNYESNINGNFIVLEGPEWRSFGHEMNVNLSLAVEFDGQLIAARELSNGDYEQTSMLAWDGFEWKEYEPNIRGRLRDMIIHNGALHVVGGLRADTGMGLGIGRFDGTSWTSLSTGGFNGIVHCLSSVNGDLYAGGSFTHFNLTLVNRVAKYSGGTWQPLQFGLSVGSVYRIKGYEGNLAVGGDYVSSTYADVRDLALWNGTSWYPIGGITYNSPGYDAVFEIASLGSDLFVSGFFSSIAGVPLNNWGMWDGSNWQIPATTPPIMWIETMRTIGDRIYFEGELHAPPGEELRGPFTWDGTQVQFLGLKAVDFEDITRFKNEIVFVGGFRSTGAVRARNFARYSLDQVPWIARHPQDTTANIGSYAVFTTQPAAGYDILHMLSYQWQVDTTPTASEPTWNDLSDNDVTSGATTRTLHITSVTPDHATRYRCIVSSPCGTVTSEFAWLTVTDRCLADYNGAPEQGDILDFLDFFDDFGACSNLPSPCGQFGDADINGDTIVDIIDFLDFIDSFSVGC